MAGDANAGGGGSVYWTIDVNNVDDDPVNTTCEDQGNGHFHQRGRDKDGGYGDLFTISIKIPSVVDGDPCNRDAFLGLFKAPEELITSDGRLTFKLPIEKDKKQINIKWGDTSNLPRQGGGSSVKHPHALANASTRGAAAKKRPVKKASAKKTAKRGTATKKSKAARKKGR